MSAFVKEKLTYLRAKVTFICIEAPGGVAIVSGGLEYRVRSSSKKTTDKVLFLRVKGLPDGLKAVLVDISDNNSAAKSAENITIRVDMYPFCAEKILFTIFKL